MRSSRGARRIPRVGSCVRLTAYGELASISQYVLVEPDIRRVEVVTWVDGTPEWGTLGPGDQLRTRYGEWSLDDIYDAVDGRSSLQ